ncbi:CocE/NonD family hydrolase [Sphingobium sp. LMA1-1-1.1]
MPHKTIASSGEGALPGLVQASMLTSDGVRLDADIWMPLGEEDAPVLLMRQAYGRRLGSALCYAHPAWYARQGFIVVIQDVRGRGTSEGEFTAFVHEARDGAEAIEWAAALPRSNGRVGLYGFSYQGTNQLLAAGLRPPALRAMAPAMIGWDLFADWASEDGALRLASNISWGIQMAAGTAEHRGEMAAWEELFAASRALPLNAPVNARPPVLERHRALGHYHDWLERPASDPYWSAVSPSAALAELRAGGVPALFVGGWFDTHLPGTLAGFDALGGALMIGPWTHFPWDRSVADRDFGSAAVSPVDHAQVRWFRRWLMDDANVELSPPISLFDMGTCEWRTGDIWPEERTTFHLGGEGIASVDGTSATLGPAPGETCIEYLVHDPWRPAPSVGGAFGTPPGPVYRAKVDNRTDVLTFTTAPLEDSLALFGEVGADLAVACDSPAFDLACVLSRIDARGRVTQIAEGHRSLLDHRAGDRIAVSLRKTCATLRPGERLRLSIAAAAYPAYPVNPGTGRRPADAPRSEARLITIGIITGGADGSLLHLSMAQGQTTQQENQDYV